jgi:predicted nucleotidyltransferase
MISIKIKEVAMCKKSEMIEMLQPVVDGISALNGVEKIILFGSFATERQTITSDVDIAVVYTTKDVKKIISEVSLGIYDWYSGDAEIQATYIPYEKYLHDQHELNVSSSVRRDGITLWQR